MCGRTCLTLNPEEIIQACKYRSLCKTDDAEDTSFIQNDKIQKEADTKDILVQELLIPCWRAEYNCGRIFVPSINIAPSDICPVLVSSSHFRDDDDLELKITKGRVIVPMMWGMIPFWHRGDYRKHGLTTNNCRFEHMLESKLYRGPFQRGQRCVILCEGFYEWQTTKSAKPSERAPYFIYGPQQDGVRICDRKTWTPDNINLLKLAGLYDIWENDDGDKIFSFSVITFEASKLTSWLHHRMPAILETEQQVDDWLDYKRVAQKEALSLLRPATELAWHRVANIVNNSRNKTEDCNKPLEMVKAVPKNKIMNAWLNMRKRHEDEITKQCNIESEEESAQNCSSDSDIYEQPAKRPCFRDFKKIGKIEPVQNKEENDGKH